MAFLAITPTGLKEALRLAAITDTPVWCGADAISEPAYLDLQAPDLSRFDHELGTRDSATLQDALRAISLHHPNEHVWVDVPLTVESC